MFITKELLELNGACSEHVAIFARQWPKGVEVTLESLNEAHAIGLDIFWLERLIPAIDRNAYYSQVRSIWNAHTKKYWC